MLNVRHPPPLQHFLFSLAPGFVDILNFYCPNILSLLFVSAMAVFSPRHFLFLPGKKKSSLITQQPWLISQLVVFNIPDSLVLWHFSLHAAGVQWRSGGDVCFGHAHTLRHTLWPSYCGALNCTLTVDGLSSWMFCKGWGHFHFSPFKRRIARGIFFFSFLFKNAIY